METLLGTTDDADAVDERFYDEAELGDCAGVDFEEWTSGRIWVWSWDVACAG